MPGSTTSPTSSGRAASLPPDQRRQAIVEAAKPLVARHGRQVTTRALADAAGVAEGTLFRVFDDKDELVLATANALLDPSILDQALADLDPAGTLEDQLAAVVAVIEQRITDVWHLLGQLGPELRSRVVRPTGRDDALTELLAAHAHRLRTDPGQAARLLRGVTMALTHPMLADGTPSTAEIVDFFCHGAVHPGNGGDR